MRRSSATHALKVKRSETSIHMEVEKYLRVAWPTDLPYTHFPAGEKRDERVGGKLKRMGLKAGWPDFQFILPNGQAAFIELKKPDGKGLSDDQIDVRAHLVALRCGYAVCLSVDDVEAAVTRWLAAFHMKPRATLIQRRAA